MSYNRLIHDYLDTGLDSVSEESLFAALSDNPELRDEFNKQLRIHNVSKMDFDEALPPPAVTENIFKGLGFESPVTEPKPKVFWWNRYKEIFVSAIILLLLSSLLLVESDIFNGSESKLSDNNNSQSQNQSNIPMVSSIESDEDSSTDNKTSLSEESSAFLSSDGVSSSAKSNAKNANSIARTNDSKNLSSKRYVTSNASGSNNINSMQAIENTGKQAKAFRLIETNNGKQYFVAGGTNSEVFSSLTASNRNSRNEYQQFNVQSSKKFYFDNTKWQFSFNGINNLQSPSYNVASNSGNLTHFGLELFHKFSYSHWLGVEFGNDIFPQEFYVGGEDITVRQNPALYWWGISYKYRPDYQLLYGFAEPFTKLTVGGTEVGALGRAQLGLQFRFFNNVSFIFAADASTMHYNVGGTLYNTNQLGMVYGIGINF